MNSHPRQDRNLSLIDDLRRAVDAAIQRTTNWHEAFYAAIAALREHAAATGELDLAALMRLAKEIEAAAAAVPASRCAAHREWAMPRKYVLGAEQPGVEEPVLSLLSRFPGVLIDLRYSAERCLHPGPCDCSILASLGTRRRRPDSPSLRFLSTKDALYHAEYVCDACGMRWTEYKDCDDVGVRADWVPSRVGCFMIVSTVFMYFQFWTM